MVIHECKKMWLETSFPKAEKAVKTALLDAELTKGEYVQAFNSNKSKCQCGKGSELKATPSALAIAKAITIIQLRL